MTAPICRVLTLLLVLTLGTLSTPLQILAGDSDSERDRLVARRLDQLWFQLGDDMGGYGDLDFAQPPSLYRTVWNLEVAHRYEIATPTVNRDEAARWLSRAIETPEEIGDLPPVTTIQLAVRGLVLIGVAPPHERVAHQLERLRTEWGYASTPGDSPSWGATAASVEALITSDLTVPDEVTQALISQLPLATSQAEQVADDFGSSLLAQWTMATTIVPADLRQQLKNDLRSRLEELVSLYESAPCDGLILAGYERIRYIADHNDVAIDLPQQHIDQCFESLAASDGFLTLFPDDLSYSDPHTTFSGAALGRPVNAQLVDSLQATADASGWKPVPSGVTPKSTFHAVSLSHAAGRTDRDPLVRNLVSYWLDRFQPDVSPDDPTAESLEQYVYVFLLARDLDVPIPDRLAEDLATALRSAATKALPVDDRVRLLRIASLTGTSVPDSTITDAWTAITDASQQRHQELAMLVILADLEPIPDRRNAIRQTADLLSINDGLFVQEPGVTVPHIRSTVTGLYATGELENEGPAVNRVFTDDRGTWGYPPGSAGTPYIDIETTYLGFVLEGRIEPEYGLP